MCAFACALACVLVCVQLCVCVCVCTRVPKVPKVPKVLKVPKNKNIINIPFSHKKYSKALKKSSGKTSRVFIEQVDNKQIANIIANFLKNNLIKDKHVLDNRVAIYIV